jgi:hypothetical protein
MTTRYRTHAAKWKRFSANGAALPLNDAPSHAWRDGDRRKMDAKKKPAEVAGGHGSL